MFWVVTHIVTGVCVHNIKSHRPINIWKM